MTVLKVAAHEGGPTRLALAPGSKRLLTGGSDALVKAFEFNVIIGDRVLETYDGSAEQVTCIECDPIRRGRFAVGAQDGTVMLYDGEHRQKICHQNACQIYACPFSPCGTRLAVASDNGLRVISLDAGAEGDTQAAALQITKPLEPNETVLAATWTRGNVLIAAGTSGVYAWDMGSGAPVERAFARTAHLQLTQLRQRNETIASAVPFVRMMGAEAFAVPRGRQVAVQPLKGKEVLLTVPDLPDGQEAMLVKADASGDTMVVVDTLGYVTVYNLRTMGVLVRTQPLLADASAKICDLLFHPTMADTLVVATDAGTAQILAGLFTPPAKQGAAAKADNTAGDAADGQNKHKLSKEERKRLKKEELKRARQAKKEAERLEREKLGLSQVAGDDVEDDDDDDDDDDGNDASTEATVDMDNLTDNESAEGDADADAPRNRFADDEASEASGTDDEKSIAMDRLGGDDDDVDMGRAGGGDDDSGDGRSHSDQDTESFLSQHLDELKGVRRGAAVVERRMQAPFQVGQTPPPGHSATDDTKILCWNSIGFVRSSLLVAEQSVSNAIAVNFYDKSKYPSMKFTDKSSEALLCLAALGRNGVVLASQSTNLSESRNRLVYKPLHSWGTNPDWTHMLDLEVPQALAIGDLWVACFTDRYLRLFRHSGIAIAVVALPHRVVCSIGLESSVAPAFGDIPPADKPQDLLAFAYDDGTSTLKLSVWNVVNRTVVDENIAIAMTDASSSLLWMGWTDEGMLAVQDSSQVIRVLSHTFGRQWVPVYDPIFSYTHERLHLLSVKGGKAYGVKVDIGVGPDPRVDDHRMVMRDLRVPVLSDRPEPWPQKESGGLYQSMILDAKMSRADHYTRGIAGVELRQDAMTTALFKECITSKYASTTRALDLAMMMNIKVKLEEAMQFAYDNNEAPLYEKLRKLFELEFGDKRDRRNKLPDKAAKRDKDGGGGGLSAAAQEAVVRQVRALEDRCNGLAERVRLNEEAAAEARSQLQTQATFTSEGASPFDALTTQAVVQPPPGQAHAHAHVHPSESELATGLLAADTAHGGIRDDGQRSPQKHVQRGAGLFAPAPTQESDVDVGAEAGLGYLRRQQQQHAFHDPPAHDGAPGALKRKADSLHDGPATNGASAVPPPMKKVKKDKKDKKDKKEKRAKAAAAGAGGLVQPKLFGSATATAALTMGAAPAPAPASVRAPEAAPPAPPAEEKSARQVALDEAEKHDWWEVDARHADDSQDGAAGLITASNVPATQDSARDAPGPDAPPAAAPAKPGLLDFPAYQPPQGQSQAQSQNGSTAPPAPTPPAASAADTPMAEADAKPSPAPTSAPAEAKPQSRGIGDAKAKLAALMHRKKPKEAPALAPAAAPEAVQPPAPAAAAAPAPTPAPAAAPPAAAVPVVPTPAPAAKPGDGMAKFAALKFSKPKPTPKPQPPTPQFSATISSDLSKAKQAVQKMDADSEEEDDVMPAVRIGGR